MSEPTSVTGADDGRASAWTTVAAGLLLLVVAAALDFLPGDLLHVAAWLMAGAGLVTAGVGTFRVLVRTAENGREGR